MDLNENNSESRLHRISRQLETAVLGKIAEAIATGATVLLLAIATMIASQLPLQSFESIKPAIWLAALGTSLLVNVGLAFWLFLKYRQWSQKLTIKYGMLWDKDKNPHCPSCRKPSVEYGDWSIYGKSYYCNSCRTYTTLKDSQGEKVEPKQAIRELE